VWEDINESAMRNKIFITEINREFEEVIEGCVRSVLRELNNPEINRTEKSNGEPRDIINIDAASQLIGYSKATVYSKVSLNQIPVLTRGKPLLFSRKSLELWIEAGRPKISSMTFDTDLISEKQRK